MWSLAWGHSSWKVSVNGKNRYQRSTSHSYPILNFIKRHTSTQFKSSWPPLTLFLKTKPKSIAEPGAALKFLRIVSSTLLRPIAKLAPSFSSTKVRVSGMTILLSHKTWLHKKRNKLQSTVWPSPPNLTRLKLHHQRSCSKFWGNVAIVRSQSNVKVCK